MISTRDREEARKRRHTRIRKKVTGTAERPRLAVFISLKHVYAQLIDDSKGITLAAASNLKRQADGSMGTATNASACEAVGRDIAEKALALGIKTVAFDRGGHSYHGRVKALAEAARAAGLEF
jgi:large subunit ribosomal protein L18